MSILAGVCSQLIIKWRTMTKVSHMVMGDTTLEKVNFLFKVIFDPFILLAIFLTFVAGMAWIATMTKLEISYAYPFTMFGFVAVMACSVLLFGEVLGMHKIIGGLFILLGVFIVSRGL